MRRNPRTPSSANADSGEGLFLMLKPQRGICCAGCPHRAAYVVVKDVIRRGRGHVICGEAGCPAVGHVHPAATACPGGQAELMSMYNKPVPQGTPEEPGSVVCAHFALDADVAADDGARFGAEQLAGEGACAILCVMASSKVDPDACAGCDLCSDYCRTRVILTPRADMTPAQRHAERLAAAGA